VRARAAGARRWLIATLFSRNVLAMNQPTNQSRTKRDFRFLLALVLLTLLAYLIRQHFILVTQVEAPIRGDIRQYVAYAWNLLHHGVFSQTPPGEAIPSPDKFRSPGYPAFLLTWMALARTGDGWYWLALHAQAALGALTATLSVLIARHWLPRGWALLAGMLVAVWPHHVAATGALLSEVVFGFVLAVAALATAETLRRRQARWAVAAGIAWGGAALINPVSLLFPLIVAVIFLRERLSHCALLFVVAAMLGPGAWGARNMKIDAAPPGRAAINIAQGSWPLYHEAHIQVLKYDNPIAHAVMDRINKEAMLLATDPASGFSALGQRMAEDPAYYLRWYILQKPYLLWDWDIRLGAGDVYFHAQRGSPLDGNPVLSAVKSALQLLNPAIFGISAIASGWLVYGWFRRRPWAPAAAGMVAAFCLYITAIHVLFQAEPRYAIPYRPFQMLMVAGFLALIARYWLPIRLALTGNRRQATPGGGSECPPASLNSSEK